MLPVNVIHYLQQAAQQARTELPAYNASLFSAGVLDSFALVDFVALLESECGLAVADAELRPENFDTLAKIEAFVSRAQEVSA
jgi:acyl carrier protein